jgi:hypothetical protein
MSNDDKAAEDQAEKKRKNEFFLATVLTENDCLNRTLQSLASFETLARSSFGPEARYKIIHFNPSSPHYTFTSTSNLVFSQLPVQHPVARVLMRLILQQVAVVSKIYKKHLFFSELLSGMEAGSSC